MFVKDIKNYNVTGSLAKYAGSIFLNTDSVVYIVDIDVNLNGVDTTLCDVIGNSGRICVVNLEDAELIVKTINEQGPIKPILINTYKLIDGVYTFVDGRYTYLYSISKIRVIYPNGIEAPPYI